MSGLRSKSIHELRAILQGYGDRADLFSMTPTQLVQAIESKQQGSVAQPVVIPSPQYDARLMMKPPSKITVQNELIDLLKPYTDRGLHLSFPDPESWRMQWGKREDNGTLRMPLRVALDCAQRIMR